MAPRSKLHAKLKEIGVKQVHYNPPESVKLQYPCIIYNLDDANSEHADNAKYIKYRRYTLTLIDGDPDSVYIDPILELPLCSFDRSYKSEGLNHFTFTIYN